MRLNPKFGLCGGLLLTSVVFMVLEARTHVEIFLHLAAVPLEVLLAVFVVEHLLERRERLERRRQLTFIKSYLFRSEMRGLFLANFEALASPALTMSAIRKASLEGLQAMRAQAERIEYRDDESLEAVVREYVKARDVWVDFMNRAISYGFHEIFHDMIHILHFVSDVTTFHERRPDGGPFVREAARNPAMARRYRGIVEDGIRRFLDYAIELKRDHPHLFEDMMGDYEAAAAWRKPQPSPA